MICNILCVGTELLLGQIDDTNSSYIARELLDNGILSYEHRRVGDNPFRIEKAILELLDLSDAVIVTGGLGPTHDDITREVVAKIMGVQLKENSEVLKDIENKFRKRRSDMPENNKRQSLVPEGATIIKNKTGTAPGLICPIGQKTLYLLPGVPYELKPMLEDVIAHMNQHNELSAVVVRTLKTWGISESQLAEKLDAYVVRGETSDVKIGFLASSKDGVYVKFSAQSQSKEEAVSLIDPVLSKVAQDLGDLVYAIDDETMDSVTIDLLKKHDYKLAIAESLTGGMLSSRVVEVHGVSSVLLGAIVSYAPQTKHRVLGVDTQDVYSLDCALQMAKGVRSEIGAEVGISTTGVAGPKSDNGHEPGEVYVGISTPEKSYAKRYNFTGDRLRVRQYSSTAVLNLLRLLLLNGEIEADLVAD